jgi:hypothetical protein
MIRHYCATHRINCIQTLVYDETEFRVVVHKDRDKLMARGTLVLCIWELDG